MKTVYDLRKHEFDVFTHRKVAEILSFVETACRCGLAFETDMLNDPFWIPCEKDFAETSDLYKCADLLEALGYTVFWHADKMLEISF